MLKRNFVRWAVLPLAMIAAVGLINQLVMGAGPSSVSAHMDTFTSPDGVTDFALSLKLGETASAGPHDVVILFNTSAGQTGDFRTKAIETLKGVLAGLPAGDRVHLLAVDLNAVPLTKTFVCAEQ